MEERIHDSSMENLWNLWYSELHKNRTGLTFRVNRVVHSSYSDFQRIEVFDTTDLGKVLLLYGSIMITEKDEFVYHEMIAHTPLNVHPNPKEVLIIGGGDGGTLREVVKHETLRRATMVEIDSQVVAISREFFPSVASAFDHPKTNLIFDDGAKFVNNTTEKYDVVLADISDPVGPAEVVFQKPFHQSIYDILNEDGVFVAQTESPYYHEEIIRKLYRNLNSIFPIVRMFIAYIPTYPGSIWSFCFCSKKYDPIEHFRGNKIEDLRYYNPGIHTASFALPNYVEEMIKVE